MTLASFSLIILALLLKCYDGFITKPLVVPKVIKHESSILKAPHNSQFEVQTRTWKLSSSADQTSAIENASKGRPNAIYKVIDTATSMFPLWVLACSAIAFKRPKLFFWFLPYVTPALTLTMIGMGMTLSMSDFKNVLQSWPYVLVGFFAQYTIMPLSAMLSAKMFNLSPDLAAGLILVGCAPGGTASNLVTLIAKADLALSILMTAASTVAAVFMTPFLVTNLVGSSVNVNSVDLVASTMSVVLLPVLLGLTLNTKAPKLCSALSAFTPLLSVILVALICGSVSASNAGIMSNVNGINLIGAIICLHALGFGVGYAFAKIFKSTERQARTISIETGMQNSALAVVLAKHFPNPTISSLPGAISATCHSLLGSSLAALWRKFDNDRAKEAKLAVEPSTAGR